MKKWAITFASALVAIQTYASDHSSFLVTDSDLREESYYGYGIETPRFFTFNFPENIDTTRVELPLLPGGFKFGISLPYLRPIDNQLDYAVIDPNPAVASPGATSFIKSIDPNHKIGYGAFIGYDFPFSSRDLRLNFQILSTASTDDIGAPFEDLLNGTIWTMLSLNGLSQRADAASSKLDSTIGTANLEMGHQILAGSRFELHPFTGIGFTNIHRNVDTNYLNTSIFDAGLDTYAPVGDTAVNQKSHISGVGPRIGADAFYHFFCGFGLAGHLANTIYIGKIRSSTQTETPTDAAGINLQSTDRIVPELEGKLGIAYIYPFTTAKFKLELGYQTQHFFNAVDSYRAAAFAGGYNVKVAHDITLDGPYLDLSIYDLVCPSTLVAQPIYLTAPKLPGGFAIGVAGIYLRPTSNHVDYALTDPAPVFDTSGLFYHPSKNAQLLAAESDNQWAYRAFIGYVFQDTPYDLKGSYQNLNTSEHSQVRAPTGGVIWDVADFGVGFINAPIVSQQAKAHVKFNYQLANFELGHRFDADALVQLRLLGGLSYVSVKKDAHITYNNVQSLDPTILFAEESVVQESHFNGAGPRVGADLNIPFRYFELRSHFAASMYYGRINGTYRNNIPTNLGEVVSFPTTVIGVNLDHDNQIIPAFDSRIGFAFTNMFSGYTRWVVEIGYQVEHYFNSEVDFRHVNDQGSNIVTQFSDVSFDGPYLEISVADIGSCEPACVIHEPIIVVAPPSPGGIEFGAEYLYWHTEATNLDFALVDPSPQIVNPIGTLPFPAAPGQHSTLKAIEPDLNSGYRLHLGYHFPLTANDLGVNYTEFTSKDSGSAVAPVNGVVWPILSHVLIFVDSPTFDFFAASARATDEHHFNSANIEFGRHLKIRQLDLRTFAGVSWQRLTQQIKVTYLDGTSIIGEPLATDSINQQNEFRGLGPHLGVDAVLPLLYGFGFAGHASTDFLVGHLDADFFEFTSDGDSTALNPDSRWRVVTNLDLKVGLAYSVLLPYCGKCSQLLLEAGYEAMNLFNVVDSLRFTTGTGEANVKMDKDVGFSGTYFKIQLTL